jgi:hypothetical protein
MALNVRQPHHVGASLQGPTEELKRNTREMRATIKNINVYRRLAVTFSMRIVTTIKQHQQFIKESHLTAQTATLLRIQNVNSHISEQTSIQTAKRKIRTHDGYRNEKTINPDKTYKKSQT